MPQRYGLVDLGCGPGKIAAELAPHFETVIGIDPAAAMIDEARRRHALPNTKWLHVGAEDAELPPAIDLVTAGTAVHWMRHDVVFPKLAQRTGLVAIVTGDAPQDPPWQAQWRALMTRWLSRCDGVAYDETAFQADGRSYEPWLDIAGRKQFRFTFRQSLNDFIACQHSRASWPAAAWAKIAQENSTKI
ncbi:MAG: class I SAM-dependent methyltransferase [Rhizomicrobium sp.]